MANMSYCRFENTYRDLLDCYGALEREGTIEDLKQSLGNSERKYATWLIELCQQIVDMPQGEEYIEDEDLES